MGCSQNLKTPKGRYGDRNACATRARRNCSENSYGVTRFIYFLEFQRLARLPCKKSLREVPCKFHIERQHETQFRLKISHDRFPARGVKIVSVQRVQALRIPEEITHFRGRIADQDLLRAVGLGSFLAPLDPKIRNHSAIPKSLIFENTSTASEKNGLPSRNAVLALIPSNSISPCSDLEEIPRHHKRTRAKPSSSNCASGPRR